MYYLWMMAGPLAACFTVLQLPLAIKVICKVFWTVEVVREALAQHRVYPERKCSK